MSKYIYIRKYIDNLKESYTYLPFISAYFCEREEEKPLRSIYMVFTTTTKHFILSILENYYVE